MRRVETRGLGKGDLYDLVDAGPELGATLLRAEAKSAPDRILSAIERADALVVATPVYKASYTGLFKHLFDLIEPKMLEGRPVLLAATGGSERHALVIEHHLRPLFAFFRANTLPIGLYATGGDFLSSGEPGEALHARIAPFVEQLADLLEYRQARAKQATLESAA